MKFFPTVPLILLSAISSTSGCLVMHFFRLNVYDAACEDLDQLVEAFNELYNSPSTGCPGGDGSQELYYILGAVDEDGAAAELERLCKAQLVEHQNSQSPIDFKDSVRYYDDAWVKRYFNGGTKFNEEVATLYPPEDDDGDESNLLENDAEQVELFYEGQGTYGKLAWPSQIDNFGSMCQMNAAMCCWVADRQARDNNGNCKTPYDTKCVDKNPGDNTDLCYVDSNDSASITGYEDLRGSLFFVGDDGNNGQTAEGAVHCHGLAWADNAGFETDPSYAYRGNNLFYVSLYDHLFQRGYVRNVPAAPMCACVENMPVVSRSDCTQIDFTTDYVLEYDGTTASIELQKVAIDFNACEGTDPNGNDDNNDLWSYAHELYLQGKYSADKLRALSKRLVGDNQDTENNCDAAIKSHLASKGLTRGYNHDAALWRPVGGRDALSYMSPMGAFSFASFLPVGGIIRRVCPYCDYTHRNVYYKRITTIPSGLDLLDNLKFGKARTTGNVYGTDFLLYSTFDDAVNGQNEWACQAYNYGAGFPGKCTPTGGSINDQQSPFSSQKVQRDVGFYAQQAALPWTEEPITSIGSKDGNGHTYSLNNQIVVSGVGASASMIDSLDFRSSPVSGDFTLEVTIANFAAGKRNARTGLMVRSSSDANSPLFAVTLQKTSDNNEEGRLQVNFRKTAGARLITKGKFTVTSFQNHKIRLVKTGDVFSGYRLQAGAWVLMRTIRIGALNTNLAAGLYTSSGKPDRLAETVFADYTI